MAHSYASCLHHCVWSTLSGKLNTTTNIPIRMSSSRSYRNTRSIMIDGTSWTDSASPQSSLTGLPGECCYPYPAMNRWAIVGCPSGTNVLSDDRRPIGT